MYSQRRQRLLTSLGANTLIVPSAEPAIRNNDVEHEYRQSSDFYYLTGFDEPHALLVLTGAHATHRAVLFMQERDPERELWDGRRLGVEAAPASLGVDAAFPISSLEDELPKYLSGADQVHVRLGEQPKLDALLFKLVATLRSRNRRGVVAPNQFVDVASMLHEIRLRKDEHELATLRRAAAVTAEAHEAAMRFAAPGRFEYEIEGELLRAFRQGGSARTAYGSIVGSGVNATVLHYRSNDRQMQDGDLLLIDAGCELDYYASDVTRTFPVNGTFSGPQRDLYEAVLRAQLAACEAVRPGTTLAAVHEVALTSLVDSMLELGLLAGTRDEVLEKETYKPFYMHQTSHWLGMDVHDVGSYTLAKEVRPLEPNMVLTVEPGLYVREDADAPAHFRGIGIRIEDDVVVSQEGHENLTKQIPKTLADVERVTGA